MDAYRFNSTELKCLDSLKKIFLSSKYSFDRWPEVYYITSDEYYSNLKERPMRLDHNLDGDYNIHDIDYLGLYVYNTDEFKSEEGKIFMFKDRIQLCSQLLEKELSTDYYHCELMLRLIVLTHEIGHWFTHWQHIKNQMDRANMFHLLTKEIKESLAQLSVYWSFTKLQKDSIFKDALTLFYFLTDRQSYEYRQYKKMLAKQISSKKILNQYHTILDNLSNLANNNGGLDYIECNYFITEEISNDFINVRKITKVKANPNRTLYAKIYFL